MGNITPENITAAAVPLLATPLVGSILRASMTDAKKKRDVGDLYDAIVGDTKDEGVDIRYMGKETDPDGVFQGPYWTPNSPDDGRERIFMHEGAHHPEILAHELGHHDVYKNLGETANAIGGYGTNTVSKPAGVIALIANAVLASVGADKKTMGAVAGANALLQAPGVGRELLASYYGQKRLKEHGGTLRDRVMAFSGVPSHAKWTILPVLPLLARAAYDYAKDRNSSLVKVSSFLSDLIASKKRKELKIDPYKEWESESYDPDEDKDYFYFGKPEDYDQWGGLPRIKNDDTLADSVRARLASAWGVSPDSFANDTDLAHYAKDLDELEDMLGSGLGYSVMNETGLVLPPEKPFMNPATVNEFCDALRPYLVDHANRIRKYKAAEKWLQTASKDEQDEFWRRWNNE